MGDKCSYFKRVSKNFTFEVLCYIKVLLLLITFQCSQIAAIVAFVEAYNVGKSWLRNQQIVRAKLTTYVFETRVLDSGTKFCTQVVHKNPIVQHTPAVPIRRQNMLNREYRETRNLITYVVNHVSTSCTQE